MGFRFRPTKEEILIYYLRPAIKREPLPGDVMMKIEIYGDRKEPWNLFDKDSSDTFWVFTMLKKKNDSMIDRVAGCGSWVNQGLCKKINDSGGKLLGFDKYFTFNCRNKCCGRGNKNINGNWTMHEYSFADEGLSEYVICEIKNNIGACSNKKRKGGGGHIADVDDVNGGSSMPVTKKVCVEVEQNNHNFGELLGHQENNNNPIFMDRTQSQTNSCSPQQPDPEFNNGSVCPANACDWKEFSFELEDLLSGPATDMENQMNFGGNNNPIFMDRTQSQTMVINSCSPQQGDGDEAFGQPHEFTNNASVSFTVNDNIEAVNLEASADACDYWNKLLFSELEDFSDLGDLLNECT
ncbi:No apical meristem (NAM) protein [Corchorus olitorius]|uniref:No apical meristem (NAM) protein n=1 Tax=Corchorus olitorius TaxID=93759 RepID=A0A1R3HIH0_9ROSI|nr:No apical meristem (NAM) protein [Corchorus olitorius]